MESAETTVIISCLTGYIRGIVGGEIASIETSAITRTQLLNFLPLHLGKLAYRLERSITPSYAIATLRNNRESNNAFISVSLIDQIKPSNASKCAMPNNVQSIAHPLYHRPSKQRPSKNTGPQRETSGRRWNRNCRVGILLQVSLPEWSD